MTAYLIVCLVAFVAAGLTLFSGFGLGTLLLPVLALFFPVELAVAGTAVVHLLNNVFKLVLVGRDGHLPTVFRFGLPALVGAAFGAWLLLRLAGIPALATYRVGPVEAEVSAIKLVVATLIFVFALVDLGPGEAVRFDPRFMPLGGLLSGTFGGLSGHQGALRSAFLINSGLGRSAFVGTAAWCSVLVDATRLTVYGGSVFLTRLDVLGESSSLGLLAAATLAAFAGSFVGARLVKRVTLRLLQRLVGGLLLLFALALGAGWI